MSQFRYHEAASAAGAWATILAPSTSTTRERAQDILAAACTEQTPVSAAIQEFDGLAFRIALLRDPSTTHGTPSIKDCSAFAERLAESQDWRRWRGFRVMPAIAVVLGLREGYDPAATVHAPETVRDHLDERGVRDYGLAAAHLFSARRIDGEVRTYEEPGVVIDLEVIALPSVVETAGHLRQDRFVVTDFAEQRTYALRRPQTAGQTEKEKP